MHVHASDKIMRCATRTWSTREQAEGRRRRRRHHTAAWNNFRTWTSGDFSTQLNCRSMDDRMVMGPYKIICRQNCKQH